MKRAHSDNKVEGNGAAAWDGPSVSVLRSDYDRLPFPNFSKPVEIGSFSTDSDKQLVNNRSQLSHLKKFHENSKVEFDLNEGYSTFIESDDKKLYLNLLLEWIKSRLYQQKPKQQQSEEHHNRPSLKASLFNADFVMWRGCLTIICNTPYENRNDWIIAVVKMNGVYFLVEYETERKKEERLKQTDRERRMTYWGHKFERFVITDQDGNSVEDQVVNCKEQFCSVVKAKLGDHRLVFAGETDCIDQEDNRHVELKTQRAFSHPRQLDNFHRFKTCKWWLQSFLIGIPRIIAGFRDDDGIVRELKTFNVNELPRNPKAGWSGSVCFNFADAILNLVKAEVKEEGVPYVLTRSLAGQNNRKSVTINRAQDPHFFNFVPHWFPDGDSP